MPIDFVKDMTVAALTAQLSWYMQNSCTISKQPIHTNPVRLIVSNKQSGTERTMPEIYEEQTLEQWFEKSKRRQDPISRDKVIAYDSCIDDEELQDTDTDVLRKLSWFIQNYLFSLQQHVAADNVEQLERWMQA